MTEIHNAELTQEIVIGSVAAWLEQINDSALNIDVSFHRDINYNSNQDLTATTKIDILKADDFRPMKRGQHAWKENDQKMIHRMQKEKKAVSVEQGIVGAVRESLESWRTSSSSERPSAEEGSMTKKVSNEVVKRVAVKRELPSAEYHSVRYDERNLSLRKAQVELKTAQEAPAVREKGDANDRTDKDCVTHPHDLQSTEEPTTSDSNSQVSEDIPPPKNKESGTPPLKEKTPEPIPEEPKKVEEEVKKPEVPKNEEPKMEEPVKEEAPKVEEKKEEVKMVEDPKVESPLEVKKMKKRIQINVKRYPDSGELTILTEKDGMVSFTCSTKHRIKKKSKKDEE